MSSCAVTANRSSFLKLIQTESGPGYLFERPLSPRNFGLVSCKEHLEFSPAKCHLKTSLHWKSDPFRFRRANMSLISKKGQLVFS